MKEVVGNIVRIKLNGIDDLRNFVHAVSQFEADVNIIKGTHTFDAKSIMGVIDIAPDSAQTYVEILTTDEEQIDKFNEAMEAYRV